LEFTGLSARRDYDKKLQVHLPILGNDEAVTSPDEIDGTDAGGSNEKLPDDEKKDQIDDLPEDLADIIRDLTGRSSL
jgi:hypothetical protein